jgi:hypothetical protein
LHICFLGAYSTYLSRKLPSGRLCEQKKDILRPDGKRRAEGSPDFSVCRMRTMPLVWNNLRFFPWMLQNIIIWLLSCFLRSYRNFLLIISLIIIWSLITCAILDKPQFKHYLHLFFVLKQVILWNVFLYWEKLRHKKTEARFEVLTVLNMKTAVVWVMTPCRLIDRLLRNIGTSYIPEDFNFRESSVL